jgi:hypothetical protein
MTALPSTLCVGAGPLADFMLTVKRDHDGAWSVYRHDRDSGRPPIRLVSCGNAFGAVAELHALAERHTLLIETSVDAMRQLYPPQRRKSLLEDEF